jgi:hypothetical protein
MPFKTGARIVITNESNSKLNLLYFDVDFITSKTAIPDMLYFHACWNRSVHGELGSDFELLPLIEGKGRFLGVNVGVNVDASYGKTWWGEGEVKMFIDGDQNNPTINGTGAEDYIGTGWGEGSFTHMYQGCTIADTSKKQYAFYRFHVPDAIYFDKNFKAVIQQIGGGLDGDVKSIAANGIPLLPVTVANFQGFTRLMDNPVALTDTAFPHGWVNFYRIDDYSATAYFYLDRPASNLKALDAVEKRVK